MREPELPDSLTSDQQRIVRGLSEEVGETAGVAAVVLGGSHARGRSRPGSDIDLGVLRDESEPLDVEALRAIAGRWHTGSAAPTVTNPGEWGPWVDGGAWLEIDGTRVDLLYRSFDLIESVWRDAQAGRFEHHWGQQAPFGFFGPTVLGETQISRGLHGALARVEAWKQRVAEYPPALRTEVVRALLWQVEFNLTAFLPKFCAREDAYGAAGCLSRAAYHLVLVLFALNERYPVNDKTALDEIAEMERAPDEFGRRVRALLASIGGDATVLNGSCAQMATLFREVTALSDGLYVAR
ncbi:MAG: nucleotidyltransferase domain-containing protein [Myxococcota bacterium]